MEPSLAHKHSVAVVFPGQGSQRSGMARDFHSRFAVSRDAFVEASDALSLDVAALCFEEDARLDQTEFTQPAILTAEIAMLRALESEFGLRPAYFGGHSLGEYTALCAAGVFPLSTAVRLVHRRGELMQAAVPLGEGSMLAVIADGIARRDLSAELCAAGVSGVDVANRNSVGQVVLSGATPSIERAAVVMGPLLEGLPHEVVRLNVSAPFHSHMMRGIHGAFRQALDEVAAGFRPAHATRVTSNFTGKFHTADLDAILDALTLQLSGTVDWIANMRELTLVADEIFEVGPHRPLRGFFKSEGRDVTAIVSVRSAEVGLAA